MSTAITIARPGSTSLVDVARRYESAALRFTVMAAPASPVAGVLLELADRYRALARELRRVELDDTSNMSAQVAA